jgi:hypothetical protein
MTEQAPAQNNQEQLVTILGFDPLKENITKDILTEAFEELRKEKAANAKVKAKELLGKAVELHSQMTVAKREYENKINKFDKELGKLVNRLKAFANGRTPAEEEPAAQ